MSATKAQKKKSSGVPKAITTLILAGVVGVGAYFVVQRSSQIAEYNKIIDEAVNPQKYQEAIPRLEAFIAKAQGDLRKQASTDLAKCYLAVGDDPGFAINKRAEYYAKARALDPSTLNEEQNQTVDLVSKQPALQE